MSNSLGINLSANDSVAQFKLGTVVGNIGVAGPQKEYKYVQYSNAAGSVAAVAGNVCYYEKPGTSDSTATVVTSDVSESNNIGAGVLQAALTDNYYGWIQIRGIATLTTALTSGSDGSLLTPVGAGDGTLALTAAVTSGVVAQAITAASKIVLCNFPY
jgi:hypothetical protein